MPDSEKSYVDRAQKSRNLHAACAGYNVAYVPAPQGTSLAVFLGKIVECEGLNNSVEGALDMWSEKVDQRVAVSETIKLTSTQLLAYIESSPAWEAKVPRAKKYANAIRGIKHPRKPLPPTPPGGTPAKRRQRGGQSYAELETNWRGLVNLATGLPGFAPTSVKIQAGTLNGLLSTLRGLNETLPADEEAVSEAQKLRQKAFVETKVGLKARFDSVKQNVKGQYGTDSAEWAQVKGMSY